MGSTSSRRCPRHSSSRERQQPRPMVSLAAVRPSRTTSTPNQAPDPFSSTRCSCSSKPWPNTTVSWGNQLSQAPSSTPQVSRCLAQAPSGWRRERSHAAVDLLRRHAGEQGAALGRQLAVDVQHVTPHQPTGRVEEGHFTGAALGNGAGQLQRRRTTTLVDCALPRAMEPEEGLTLPPLPGHGILCHQTPMAAHSMPRAHAHLLTTTHLIPAEIGGVVRRSWRGSELEWKGWEGRSGSGASARTGVAVWRRDQTEKSPRKWRRRRHSQSWPS